MQKLNNVKKTKKGIVALITLMMMSIMLLVSGTTLVLSSIDLTKSSRSLNMGTLARYEAYSCLEESLLRLSVNTAYTGTVNITNTNGTCQAVITNHPTDANLKVVQLTGSVQNYNFAQTRNVDISVTPIKLV